jgi:hypothetical protein
MPNKLKVLSSNSSVTIKRKEGRINGRKEEREGGREGKKRKKKKI